MKDVNTIGVNNLLSLVSRLRKSQHLQDLFVLSELDFKSNGFFVEFGATNGLSISNTWLLEKYFNWKGILAEPALVWHDSLRMNRNCIIDTRCIWKTSGIDIIFNQTESPELSKIDSVITNDWAKDIRDVNATKYTVRTVSLVDLLIEHQAPHDIDYISVDTEGSEFDILDAFDFNAYRVKLWTIENSLRKKDWNVYELMLSKGYTRIYEGISEYDDWYCLK
jgi:FkbM family methyltransferase